VTEKIDNIAAKGQVSVNGTVWTARSSDGTVIEENEKVTIEKIEGVKVIVNKI
jgi:membrane protein implicated in regulation of membrane protease activity